VDSVELRIASTMLACALCACEPDTEIRELTGSAPRCPASEVALQPSDDGLKLVYSATDGWRERLWIAGRPLGDARILSHAPTGPLFDGCLSVDDLTGATDGSSASLPNGWLADHDKPSGWSPAVARADDGKVHLAFDSYRDGDFDVVYRAPNGNETIVAGTRRFEAHPSITIDRMQRVWLAWDSAGEDWGLEGALHESRAMHLAVLAGGEWHDAPLPWPTNLCESDRAPEQSNVTYPELPRVVADDHGPVWVLFRTMSHAPGEGRIGSNRHVAWRIRAIALTDRGWQGPWTLPHSDGGNADTLAVAPLHWPLGGIAAAYTTDDRLTRTHTPWFEPIGASPTLTAVELHARGGFPDIGPKRRCGRIDPPSRRLPPDPDPNLVPTGFVRLWGDLHRHTDHSRCKLDLDGTVSDQFRYARDVAALDFVAITDHFQHMTPETWESSCELTSRFFRPESFLTIYGFELTLTAGHRNLFCADREAAKKGPVGRVSESGDWRSAFDADDWIAIPHQIADSQSPLTWKRQDRRLEPLVEIYQQRRGSYEAVDAPRRTFDFDAKAPSVVDYLRAGWRFGVIASSDHIGVGHAFAAVYSRGRSRSDLFKALRERRTYAATAKIALDVSLGDMIMGDQGHVEPSAPLSIRADAGAVIAAIDVIRNGEVAARWHGTEPARGLLTLRVVNRETERDVSLEFKHAVPEQAVPQDLERSDGLTQTLDRVVLHSTSDSNADEDGVRVSVSSLGSESQVIVRAGHESRELSLTELASKTPPPFQLDGLAVDVRLDPPALGGTRFEERWRPGDWKPGDWVYVRLVRVDGEMAWSSPIWID
jgi:hypothetical protein